MPFRFAVLWIVLAAAAFAQAPETRVYTFVHNENPQQMQEVLNLVRLAGEIPNAHVDMAKHTMAVAGTPEQLSLTSWLFTELDKPVGPPPKTLLVRETTFADPRAPIVKIFRPVNIRTPQDLIQMVNTIRSIAGLQRVVSITDQATLVARGGAEQIGRASCRERG